MQLTLLGYILVPIFTYNQWWLVLLYACFMLYVGCLEASQRPAYSYMVNTSSLCTVLHMCVTQMHFWPELSCGEAVMTKVPLLFGGSAACILEA